MKRNHLEIMNGVKVMLFVSLKKLKTNCFNEKSELVPCCNVALYDTS
ncbi:hypothetical protein SAMN05661091_2537 [Paenibacillus uliginis N3/975]|uniref:Uncharacterized protein n=1 Tax=Paenibacillus uliginis N3/975 TaxID=1313296 RepID=A0A1X7HCZ7_9BACL|nr:hypothetical protein SAMN05661091_2537 [Paenibacillus uliginis N3/975]